MNHVDAGGEDHHRRDACEPGHKARGGRQDQADGAEDLREADEAHATRSKVGIPRRRSAVAGDRSPPPELDVSHLERLGQE